jgi:hypothetical protein
MLAHTSAGAALRADRRARRLRLVMDFQIALDDLHRCRVVDAQPRELEDGEARLRVERFGLTANNVTYAKFGEAMSYWQFFPADDGWGHMPVWGFAQVGESRDGALEEGTRVYGYLPPCSELIVTPERVNERGFRDAAAHRTSLPAAYNAYVRTDADPVYDAGSEDLQMLLRPLFFTSWLIDDFLADRGLLESNALVLSSASSKTAIGLAFLSSQRGADVLGLSSPRGAEFARSLGCYADVFDYEDGERLPDRDAVYVDMAGDARVRELVHRHYGARLAHSAVVGATHHEHMGAVPDDLPGPRPTFFFAPDQVEKRTKEWGAQKLERRLADAWHPFVEWTGGWLEVVHGHGGEELQDAYLQLLDGHVDPSKAHVFSPAGG